MIPSLSNQQSASSGVSSGGIIAISGGAGGTDLRTMLEWSRGTPENGGMPLDLRSGSFARLDNRGVATNVGVAGANAGFSLGWMPIALVGIGIFLWNRSKR